MFQKNKKIKIFFEIFLVAVLIVKTFWGKYINFTFSFLFYKIDQTFCNTILAVLKMR